MQSLAETKLHKFWSLKSLTSKGFADDLMQKNEDSMKHELKIDAAVFEAIAAGNKTFELRKNDRDYKEGDILLLRETRFTGAEMGAGIPLEYTGREEVRRVSHVLLGPIYGLSAGWAILSCRPIPHGECRP